MMRLRIYTMLALLATSSAYADSDTPYIYSNHYYKVDKVEVVEVDDEEFHQYQEESQMRTQGDSSLFGSSESPLVEVSLQFTPPTGEPSLPSIGKSTTGSDNPLNLANNLIKLGKEVWGIIAENKPKVNVSTDFVSIVPLGVTDVNTLSGWSRPKVTNYKVRFTNPYGMEVVSLNFRNIFSYGGSLNGEGAYIANATIVPAHLKVMWGYSFSAKALTGMALNLGTKDSPVAGIEMHMNYQVDTIMNHYQATLSYVLDGEGNIQLLK